MATGGSYVNKSLLLNADPTLGSNQAFAADAMQKAGLKSSNVVVMGADVVHLGGAEGRRGCPSISCLTGSIDEHFACYPASMRLQRPLQEVRHANKRHTLLYRSLITDQWSREFKTWP